MNEEALLLAAATEEADRVLLLLKATTVSTNSTSSNTNQEHQQEILDAANALLVVSFAPVLQKIIRESSGGITTNTSNTVQETLPGNEERVAQQINTIHRAFLSLTQTCLDHCCDDESDDDPALFDVAMELAHRAHDDLDLPLHLPLYQRLMEMAPSFINTCMKNSLNIAQFCHSLRPEAVERAAFFGPALKALIAHGKLDEAAVTLASMNLNPSLGVYTWDRQTVADIYIQVHRAVKQSFLTTAGRRRDFTIQSCRSIVEHLEVGMLLAEKKKHEDAMRDGTLDAEDFSRMVDNCAEAKRFDDDDDDDDEENEGKTYDTDDEAPFEGEEHDLDQFVHSILTKYVKFPYIRRQFAEALASSKTNV